MKRHILLTTIGLILFNQLFAQRQWDNPLGSVGIQINPYWAATFFKTYNSAGSFGTEKLRFRFQYRFTNRWGAEFALTGRLPFSNTPMSNLQFGMNAGINYYLIPTP